MTEDTGQERERDRWSIIRRILNQLDVPEGIGYETWSATMDRSARRIDAALRSQQEQSEPDEALMWRRLVMYAAGMARFVPESAVVPVVQEWMDYVAKMIDEPGWPERSLSPTSPETTGGGEPEQPRS